MIMELNRPQPAAGTQPGHPRITHAPALRLASRSPRRRNMLAAAGIDHDAVHPGFDDGVLRPGSASPAAWVASLAYLKAWAHARTLPPHLDAAPRWILGADTACVLDGRLIGTPGSGPEARAMIQAFEDREHDVVTGVALVDRQSGERRLFADRARVRLGRLAPGELDAYVASGAWQGKAGGYNLSERLDAGWPLHCEGDPATVMGLPMAKLSAALRDLGAGPDA